MTAPTSATRAVMYARDGHRCAVCGAIAWLEAQHRRRVGMGGSLFRPAVDDLLTLCHTHNEQMEGVLQTLALARGWKVRAWVKDPGLVPVFYSPVRMWFVLTGEGLRVAISPAAAEEMMRDVYGDEWVRWEQELAA